MSFIQLDNDILNCTILTLRARVLFAVIADKSKLADGYCTMARKGLARIIGCNEKSVDRALKELLEKNIIEKRVVNYAEHLSFNHYRPTEKTDWQLQGLNRIGGGIPKMDSPVQNGTGIDTNGEGRSNSDQGGILKTDRGVDKNDHHNHTKYSHTEYSQKNLRNHFSPSQEFEKALELSDFMLAEHRKEYPDYLAGKDDNSVIHGWAQDIEKLIRLDKKEPDIIKNVIAWVKTPGCFWFSNIESGQKLRKQFERLYVQMMESQKASQSPSNSLKGLDPRFPKDRNSLPANLGA